MKKYILILVSLLLSTQAFAAGDDFRYTRRASDNLSNVFFDIGTPVSSAIIMLDVNGSTVAPRHILLGTGLSYNGTSLSIAGVPISSVTGLQTDMDGLQTQIDDMEATEGGLATWAAGVNTSLDSKADESELSSYVLKTTTVNGHALSSNVTIAKSDLSLGNVDNTSDASKPISTATQNALDLKSATGHTHAYADITGKPSLFSGAYGDLTGVPSTFTPSAHTHTASQVTDFTSSARGVISVTGGGSYNSSTGVITVTGTPAKSFNNSPSRTIVSTAAAANGFQISSTRDAQACYSSTISTSVSLSGNSSGYISYEIAATNSSTAGDWQEVGRVSSGQSGTLVVGLVLNQVGGGQVCATVPAGYYARLRSTNTNGTPTYTFNSGQEVLN